MNPKRALKIGLPLNLLLIAFAIGRGLYKTGNPARYFDEGRFTMILSCSQLLASAFVLGSIGLIRKRQLGWQGLRTPWVIWLLMSAGFVFLTLDEGFQFHEAMDLMIHKIFSIEETGWSDRIDDLIIAAYAVFGVGMMYIYRSEFKPFRGFIPYLIIGIILTGVTVVCDVISNRDDMLSMVFSDHDTVLSWKNWMSVAEGAATLLAEMTLLIGFIHAAQTAKSLPGQVNER